MSAVLEAERDFLYSLLRLRHRSEARPLVSEALRLLVFVADASLGHIEVFSDALDAPPFALSESTDPPQVHTAIGHQVIGRAFAERRTIAAESAKEDSRLRQIVAVQEHDIEAVLCVPVEAWTVRSVVYLHRSRQPGRFTERTQEYATLLAHELVGVGDQLLRGEARGSATLRGETRRLHVQLVRRALAQRGGNVTQAARDLGVARSFVYSIARMTER